jgi:small Trp-rich protein
MYLVGIGLILLVMKYLDVAPVATWAWWVVLSPFGLAVAWWSWADASGYTKRKAMEVEEAKRKQRIDRNRDAMGMLSSKNKKR